MGPVFHNTTRGVGGDVSRSPALIYKESFRLLFPWFSLAIIGVFFWSGPVTDVWLGDQYGEPVAQVFPWVVAAGVGFADEALVPFPSCPPLPALLFPHELFGQVQLFSPLVFAPHWFPP